MSKAEGAIKIRERETAWEKQRTSEVLPKPNPLNVNWFKSQAHAPDDSQKPIEI